MKAIVKVGTHDVEMAANAATIVRFKQVFGKNLLKYLGGGVPREDATAIVPELAFVMAKSAEGADMASLTQDEYVTWLEQFEGADFFGQETINAIVAVYEGQTVTEAKAKKRAGRRTEN